MALNYDYEWHMKFREIAVTNINDLFVGGTYYTNSHPEKFTFVRFLTNKEAYEKSGIEWTDVETADDIAWYETAEGHHYSLSDVNVTDDPYNPWMIFKTKEERDACETLLKVEYTRDDFDWPEDDYYGYDEE